MSKAAKTLPHAVPGEPPFKLNVGCGRNIRDGWLNLDMVSGPGVDLVCDLETVGKTPIDLPDNSVERFLLSHVIEHVRDALGLMQELWRLATPDATAVIRVPFGGSDDAWEDPTHVRPYFVNSFAYFAQPTYWRADYGYRGDWQPEKITLIADKARCQGMAPKEIFQRARTGRNWVKEMVCELRAVKPARAQETGLQVAPRLEIARG